jgi:hypothetical protein
VSRKIPEEKREAVRRRANFPCECCHTNERWQYVRFTVDHIIPNDNDSIENLGLACFHCNRRKSDKTEVFDELTNKTVALFNPRTDIWKEHFEWSEDKILIIPKTKIGRVTVDLLELNRERILQIRLADVAVKRHPPGENL